MAQPRFGARSSADDVLRGLNLAGRTMIVTGANTGIGFQTAASLAGVGARVVLACRDTAKAADAVRRAQLAYPGCRAEPGVCDLASARSVRAFVRGLELETLDTLICNAGLIAPGYAETAEGIESTVGVCHFGHFLLVRALLPRLLAAPAPRVVMVASESHRSPRRIDPQRFPLRADNYSMMTAYGQAKLANVLLANELQRRYGAQGLMACSLHPGTLVTTEIGRGNAAMRLFMKLISPFTKSPAQGAATSVWAATHEPAAELGGQYLVDCQLGRATRESGDAEAARWLWEQSEAWCRSLPAD